MKAFISYSHIDFEYLNRLHVHLATLRREGSIQEWCDRDILAGDSLDSSIHKELESSELFLALVSPDFLNSEYCYSVEMGRAIDMHHEGRVRIVPIIIEPCDWQSTPLRQFKAVPTDGKPIAEWGNQNSAYDNITKELRRIIDLSSSSQHLEVSRNEKQGSFQPKEQESKRSAYRVQRDFDEIDRKKFRDNSFEVICEYFASSVERINGTEGIKAHLTKTSHTSFTCTVINKARRNGTSHITVHAGDGLVGMGEIYFSYAENSPPNTANGGFRIETNGYELFWKYAFTFAVGAHHNVEARHVAEFLWKQVLANAGISVED